MEHYWQHLALKKKADQAALQQQPAGSVSRQVLPDWLLCYVCATPSSEDTLCPLKGCQLWQGCARVCYARLSVLVPTYCAGPGPCQALSSPCALVWW
jgi:hypothetical protein